MTFESCVTHAPVSRSMRIREDYLGICAEAKSPHCAAALLGVFEHWTNHKYQMRRKQTAINEARKKKGKPATKLTNLWVFMSQEELTSELMGLYGETMIMKTLTWLEEKKFIARRNNRQKLWDRKYQYLLMTNHVQAALHQWATGASAPDHVRQTAISQKYGMGLSKVRNGSRKNTAAIPQDSTQSKDISNNAGANGGGTSDVPLKPELTGKGGMSHIPAPGEWNRAEKLYPVFSISGMKYKDGAAVDPAIFQVEVNRLFYAYLEVLESVGRGAAAMHTHLWEQYRADCITLAQARITPDQLQGYVRSKYDAANKANAFWIGLDTGIPLKNIIQGITGWLKRSAKGDSAAPHTDEARRLADLEARKAAARREEQELAAQGRGEWSA